MCSYLARIPTAEILEKSAFAGAFYETYVVSEIIKSYYNSSKDYKREIYYYRDKDQKEVDLIIETFEGIYPIEIKKAQQPMNIYPSSTNNQHATNKMNVSKNEELTID